MIGPEVPRGARCCRWGTSLSLFVLLATGCAGDKPSHEAFRVAVIRYQHETCTFCPGGDTGIEDWTRNLAYDWCVSRQRLWGKEMPMSREVVATPVAAPEETSFGAVDVRGHDV